MLHIIKSFCLACAGTSQMFCGRQYRPVKCFHCTRAWELRTYNHSLHSSYTSMDTATLKGYIWKKVVLNPLEREPTWLLLLLLGHVLPFWLRYLHVLLTLVESLVILHYHIWNGNNLKNYNRELLYAFHFRLRKCYLSFQLFIKMEPGFRICHGKMYLTKHHKLTNASFCFLEW